MEKITLENYISIYDGTTTYPLDKNYVVNGTSELSNPYDGLIFYDKSDKTIKAKDGKLLVA